MGKLDAARATALFVTGTGAAVVPSRHPRRFILAGPAGGKVLAAAAVAGRSICGVDVVRHRGGGRRRRGVLVRRRRGEEERRDEEGRHQNEREAVQLRGSRHRHLLVRVRRVREGCVCFLGLCARCVQKLTVLDPRPSPHQRTR